MVLASVNHLTLTAALARARVRTDAGVALCQGRVTVSAPAEEPASFPLAFEAVGTLAERLGACGYGDTLWLEGKLCYRTIVQADGSTKRGYLLVVERVEVLTRRS